MTLPASSIPSTVALLQEKPPADPALWTLDQAQKVVRDQTPAWTGPARLAVVDGDQWQNSDWWIGPKPAPLEEGGSIALEVIHGGFTSRNVLLEVSKRYTNGVVGDESTWLMVPRRAMKPDDEASKEEQALIEEVDAALTTWWDRYDMAALFWQAVFQLSWGARSPLRLYLSRDAFTKLESEGTSRDVVQRQTTLEDALKMILLDVPRLEGAAIYVDPDTRRKVGVYLFKDAAGNEGAELCYTDRAGETFFRTIGAGQPEGRAPMQATLGGALLHHQMVRPTRLLTDAAFQMQRALNLAMTVIPRTVITAGFLERWLLNARLPGKFVDDETQPGGKRFEPDPNIEFGAGATATLHGETVDDGQGKESIAPADVKWREPIGAESSIGAAEGIYAKMLEECAQAHVLLSSEASPSGRSRREARGDYEASLKEAVLPIQSAGRWIIEATLALAEFLMGEPGKYTKTLRAQFDVKLNAGPADPEDRAQNLAEWEKGARSSESQMRAAGIQDPAAEQFQISREQGARLDMARRQAETMVLWLDMGASVELAAQVAGLAEDVAQKFAEDRKKAEEERKRIEQEERDANANAGGNNGNPENTGGGPPTGE